MYDCRQQSLTKFGASGACGKNHINVQTQTITCAQPQRRMIFSLRWYQEIRKFCIQPKRHGLSWPFIPNFRKFRVLGTVPTYSRHRTVHCTGRRYSKRLCGIFFLAKRFMTYNSGFGSYNSYDRGHHEHSRWTIESGRSPNLRSPACAAWSPLTSNPKGWCV